MVYFSVHITLKEIVHLQKTIPTEYFCLCHKGQETDFHFGAIMDEAFHSMLHALDTETLEQLEYLSEDEFKDLLEQNIVCTGNKKFIVVV